MDPKSLDTFGETFVGETIDENRPIFSAHPRVDAKRNRLVNFGSHNMQEVSCARRVCVCPVPIVFIRRRGTNGNLATLTSRTVVVVVVMMFLCCSVAAR